MFGKPDRARLALWLWCVAALTMAPYTMASTAAGVESAIELRRGSVETTVDGLTRNAPLVLPYNWDRQHAGRPGLAAFDLPFTLAAEPQSSWGIFIPRVGNVFEVRLNGLLLQAQGDLARGNGPDHGGAPVYVPVPRRLLTAGDNHLQVRIRADSARSAGLSRVTVGPAATVQGSLYEPAFAWRFTGTVLLCAFAAVVGLVAMALWLTQVEVGTTGDGSRPRRDGVYFWAAAAEFCWALQVAGGLVAEPPLAWPTWGVLLATCRAGWVASALMFCGHFAGWSRRPRLHWVAWGAAGVVAGTFAASSLSLYREEPYWLTAWVGLVIACVGLFVCAFAVSLAKRPNLERLLMAGGALAALGFALRDWLVLRLGGGYGEIPWVRYSAVFLGLALLMIVLRRFHVASAQARLSVARLGEQVAQRERELAATYAALEQVARAQARTQERERILRDMHDGVGSRISLAIRQLQSGQTNPGELLRTLRDSMDQLKLSIDSIHMPPGDIGALLAALRYRLEPRLACAGIGFEWAVDDLPVLERLDVHAMRQLQFLLFEAISNVMQHAQATTLRLEAESTGGTVRLRVIDDGQGFDAAVMPRSLRERAAGAGASLAVESRPGRTSIDIGWA
jgi:signal transduction histidine kinase